MTQHSLVDLIVSILVVERRRRRQRHDPGVVLHHQRNRSGGIGEVHEFRRLVSGIFEIAQHVVGSDARPLESLDETFAAVVEILDLLAREFTSARDVSQDSFAIRARLVDHVATLLLGHQDLVLGIGLGVLTNTRPFEFGLFTDTGGVIGRVTDQTLGRLLGPMAQLGRRFPRGLDDASGLLTEQFGDPLLVEITRHQGHGALLVGDLPLEKTLPLLKAGQFGRHHAQEIAHFGLVETPPGRGERRSRHSGRGRRIRTRKGDGHGGMVRNACG